MNLQTFVKETLCQILSGVRDAQLELEKAAEAAAGTPQRGTRGKVNPIVLGGKAEDVDFDVALTVTEGTDSKGGIGVVAGVFALGSQGSSKASEQSVSRVKFSVPIELPGLR
jgi:hypothetical protein